MKIKIIRILPTILLITALITTFSFITGFTKADSTTTMINSYAADTDEDGDNFEYLEENPEDLPVGDIPEESKDLDTFTCSNCAYVYDPSIGVIDPDLNDEENIYIAPGIKFSDLSADWTCPLCGALKSDFREDDNLKNSDPQEWLAHLEHVLAMRSKHLAVLQRVIAAHLLKNPIHPSVLSLYQAIDSSSKSVMKAQEIIRGYEESLNPGSENDTEEIIDSSNTDTGQEIMSDGTDKEKGDDENKGNSKNNENKKDNSDKNSNSSNGKNKNK